MPHQMVNTSCYLISHSSSEEYPLYANVEHMRVIYPHRLSCRTIHPDQGVASAIGLLLTPVFPQSYVLRSSSWPGRAPLSGEPFTNTTVVHIICNRIESRVKLVEDNLLGGTHVRSIWQVAAWSNQLPRHYAFNESAKPQTCPIESWLVSPLL